jgi:hypothetical protein
MTELLDLEYKAEHTRKSLLLYRSAIRMPSLMLLILRIANSYRNVCGARPTTPVQRKGPQLIGKTSATSIYKAGNGRRITGLTLLQQVAVAKLR